LRVALFAICHTVALCVAAFRIFIDWPTQFKVWWQLLPILGAFTAWILVAVALCATWRAATAPLPARPYLVALATAALSAPSWMKDFASLCFDGCARVGFYGYKAVDFWIMLLEFLVFLIALGIAANAFAWLWNRVRSTEA
jgi:hypothetical protein